jgi:hypothetical protein
MKQTTKTKILRKVLVLAFLVVAFAAVGLDSSNCVNATTCYEAWANYYNADNAYYTARLSYINGSPTTCAEDCSSVTDPTARQQCIDNCQTTRATAYYSAQLDLFSKAEGTCTPETTNDCAEARYKANQCYINYDSTGYDGEEAAAIDAQYFACITASKVDSCQ